MPRHAPDTTTGSTATHDWRQNAACKGRDGELWFPTAKANAARAKSICATCPVALDCGLWAIHTRQPAGIWGGVDERERARHLRDRGRSQSTTRTQLDRLNDRATTARDLYERHSAGESINAIAKDTGMKWWAVSELVSEGKRAAA